MDQLSTVRGAMCKLIAYVNSKFDGTFGKKVYSLIEGVKLLGPGDTFMISTALIIDDIDIEILNILNMKGVHIQYLSPSGEVLLKFG